MKRIYTLGTSLRGQEDFVEILNCYDISVVVDVRSIPSSKLEHFRKGNLEKLLRHELIAYHYLGKELGGFRKGGYEAYAETEEFSSGIAHLQEIASSSTALIICAERFPWKCHRRFIARELQERQWIVHHILDKDRIWTPERLQKPR